jgi:hypothetical protein
MSTDDIPAERLQAYLRELKPEAQTLLVTELERGALGGAGVPGADLILQALRPVLRASHRPAPRIGTPARLFYQPLEPFLVDVGAPRALPGRMERAALQPLWEWLQRDGAPTQTAAYAEAVTAALIAHDDAAAARHADAFRAEAARAVGEWLTHAERDERAARRLAAQIGTPHALDDLTTLRRVLDAQGALRRFAAHLPAAISNLSDGQGDNILGLLRQGFGTAPGTLALALLVVMARLSPFWHLIRLPIRAADSDLATRVAQVPEAAAVDIVLGEIGRRIAELRVQLRARDFAQAVGGLRDLHDACRALHSELDLPADMRWARELAALRSTSSDVLEAEIDNVAGQLRRLLRPRSAAERIGPSALDATDVAEVEGRIALADACRRYAAELAVNQAAPRVHAELKASLDAAVPRLIEALRFAPPAERGFTRSQMSAAVRFAGALYGAEYATLLVKAAAIAESDRPAARA